MKKLALPHMLVGRTSEQLWDTAVSQRPVESQSLLNALKPTAKAAWSTFEAVGHPAEVQQTVLPKSNLGVVKASWDEADRGALTGLKAEVLQSQRQCPYCSANISTDVDHFLPKGRFPEFALHVANLVPCCHTCNIRKATRTRATNGKPAFLYPYSSNSLALKVMATVSLENQTVTTDFVMSSVGKVQDDAHLARSHFERLKLNTLWNYHATIYMSEHKEAYSYYFDDGGAQAVAKYIGIDATASFKQHGGAHWQPALLTALASSFEFCSQGFALL